MKRIAATILGIAALPGLIVVTTPAQQPISEWAFVAEASDTGWAMTCLKGCAWKTLSFDCGPGQRCRVRIDQFGVGPAPDGR